NCSAGQLLASAASRRLVTQTARTGSIGVMMAHSNYGAALEKQGVEITLIYSGSHKVDGNPYSHLPDDVRETLQSRMDATRQMFAQKVSAYTGLSVQDFILGANSQEQRERLTGWIGEIAAYYAAAPVRLGGAKVPHLMPGDSLNLQTAQDTDNGYSVFEQSLLRYIAAGLGVSYEQLSRNYAQMSYSTARASANESWAYFMGRRKFVASRQASQMFLCWLEEAIVRRVVTLPSKARFSFQEARSAWGNCDWIGSGRMAIDGLKEVQEAVMLIEAGLSTYEK
ncbi:phage portal protein, partial [Pseudoxanthomonas kalamensis DSM 18571]|uniref:phage portal protein n=1 Tax=Pseudoxanthomonas kalamensis TaxID=289483 RepID=UPI0013911212